MEKRMPTLVFTIGLFQLLVAVEPLHGAMRKQRITDSLDDIVDNEEDEKWKAWGTSKSKPPPAFDPPPDFVDGMDLSKYQSEFIKRRMGPSLGFVKLRLDVHREPGEVPRIAKKWTELLKAGTIDANIVAVDRTTIMITIPDGEDILEVKDFVLSQPEAYEFKQGQNTFRRPGDPHLDVVVEKLKQERERSGKQSDKDVKEEL